ncbi:MAG: phenylalanine--tRNA ligase subunit beta [Candidatus Micrarchaeia archaeon]
MALITVKSDELERLAGVKAAKFEDLLTAIGVPVERIENGELDLEITPNRPDLLSVEGVARAIASFETGKVREYKAEKSDYKAAVDKSVQKVRPFIGMAVVRGIKIDEEFLKSLISLQEKLHDTIGRKRKKVAIGVHDGTKIKFPLTYKAVARDAVSFVPLDMGVKMTPGQILEKHPKGIDYAHLVGKECPMIVDSKGDVLSFPPVINGELTRVGEGTDNVILDVTGTSRDTVMRVLNILACAFADRGATVYSVDVGGQKCPQFEAGEMDYPQELCESLLGLKLKESERKAYLAKMGFGYSKGKALVPPYRADIISGIDIAEDIAIAHGLNNFKRTLPDFFTPGSLDTSLDAMHSALTGMGYLECSGWILTSEKKEAGAGLDPKKSLAIANKLTEDFSHVRQSIIPNLLEVLAISKNQPYPQKIYEIGPVWAGAGTQKRLAGAISHHKASFSEMKSALKTLFYEMGLDFETRPLADGSGTYIDGRAAGIYHKGKQAGSFGEIHPQVLNNFNLEQPSCAFEIDMDRL